MRLTLRTTGIKMVKSKTLISRGQIYLFLAWISIMLQVVYLMSYKNFIFMALAIILFIFAGVEGGYD